MSPFAYRRHILRKAEGICKSRQSLLRDKQLKAFFFFFYGKKSILKKIKDQEMLLLSHHRVFSFHTDSAFIFLILLIVICRTVIRSVFLSLNWSMFTVMFIGPRRCSLWDGIGPKISVPMCKSSLVSYVLTVWLVDGENTMFKSQVLTWNINMIWTYALSLLDILEAVKL